MMNLRQAIFVLVGFILTLVFATPESDIREGFPPNDENMIVLTAKSMAQMVTEDSEFAWFVDFYAPWCGHCKKMAKDWNRLAKETKGLVNIAKIDCTEHPAACLKYSVHSYPQIKLFLGDRVLPYDDHRNFRSWVSFLDDNDALGNQAERNAERKIAREAEEAERAAKEEADRIERQKAAERHAIEMEEKRKQDEIDRQKAIEQAEADRLAENQRRIDEAAKQKEQRREERLQQAAKTTIEPEPLPDVNEPPTVDSKQEEKEYAQRILQGGSNNKEVQKTYEQMDSELQSAYELITQLTMENRQLRDEITRLTNSV